MLPLLRRGRPIRGLLVDAAARLANIGEDRRGCDLEEAAMKRAMVNMHDAKTGLSRLVERAEAGEEIVIARAGKPAAKLVPFTAHRRRRLGLLDGQFMIP